MGVLTQFAPSDPALVDPDLPPTHPPTSSLYLVTLHWSTPTPPHSHTHLQLALSDPALVDPDLPSIHPPTFTLIEPALADPTSHPLTHLPTG